MASGDQSQFKKSEVPPSIPMSDGGEPLRTGVPYYSDETKRQLGIVGWKEGDPLPPDFGEALAALRDEVAADTAKAYTELPTKMAGYVPPKQKIVDIESLPPEKQEDIRKWLSGYRDDMATVAAQQPQPQPQPQPTGSSMWVVRWLGVDLSNGVRWCWLVRVMTVGMRWLR